MGKIPMRSGFTIVPEGEHVFRIYEVKFDEDFGKLEVKCVTAKGQTMSQRFNLKGNDDTYNETALSAFSTLAKAALNNYSLDDEDEIDPQSLVDHYFRGTVKHTCVPSAKDPSKTSKFANFEWEKSPADGFDEPACSKALSMGKAVKVDVDGLLDD